MAVEAYRPRKPDFPNTVSLGEGHHPSLGPGCSAACVGYIEFLKQHEFKIPMSRLATPGDNAFVESFFKTLTRPIGPRNSCWEMLSDLRGAFQLKVFTISLHELH